MKRVWKNREGVSPVIATILMVAITVVLAAVLYVMVTGLISSPTGTPKSMGLTGAVIGSNYRVSVDSLGGVTAAANSITVVVYNKTTGGAVAGVTPVLYGPTGTPVTGTTLLAGGDYWLIPFNSYYGTFKVIDSSGNTIGQTTLST